MLEELREAINVSKVLKAVLCNPTGFCCIEGSVTDKKIIDKAITKVEKLESFAQLILDSKGVPQPMEEKTINLYRADDPSYVEGEEWNSCLSLCLAAHAKEKAEMQDKFDRTAKNVEDLLYENGRIKSKLMEKIPSVGEIKDIMAVNCQMYPADEYKMSEAIHSELMKRLKLEAD